jgi:hypothetical protein
MRRHVTRPRRRPNKARTRAKGKKLPRPARAPAPELKERAIASRSRSMHGPRERERENGHPFLIHPDGSGKHCAVAATTWTYDASCACVGACTVRVRTLHAHHACQRCCCLEMSRSAWYGGCLLALMGERTQLAS